MESLIPQIIAAIPASAIPLVFVIVACWFIYWKINSQRKATGKKRDEDTDSLNTRITLLEHDVNRLKDLDLDSRLASIETSLKYIESLLKDLKDK